MSMELSPAKQTKTGYSVLRVKEATKARFDQIMQETGMTTHDEALSLLISHYTAAKRAEQQQDDTKSS